MQYHEHVQHSWCFMLQVFCVQEWWHLAVRSVVQTGLMLQEKPRSWAFTDTCDFTVRRVLPFIHECKHLLLTIADVHGQKICESPWHMAALGFAVNIVTSITMLCNEILLAESAFHQLYLLICHKIIWNLLSFSSIRLPLLLWWTLTKYILSLSTDLGC